MNRFSDEELAMFAYHREYLCLACGASLSYVLTDYFKLSKPKLQILHQQVVI